MSARTLGPFKCSVILGIVGPRRGRFCVVMNVGIERVFVARRSFVAVEALYFHGCISIWSMDMYIGIADARTHILGNSNIAASNFSCMSQILSTGLVGLHKVGSQG